VTPPPKQTPRPVLLLLIFLLLPLLLLRLLLLLLLLPTPSVLCRLRGHRRRDIIPPRVSVRLDETLCSPAFFCHRRTRRTVVATDDQPPALPHPSHGLVPRPCPLIPNRPFPVRQLLCPTGDKDKSYLRALS